MWQTLLGKYLNDMCEDEKIPVSKVTEGLFSYAGYADGDAFAPYIRKPLFDTLVERMSESCDGLENYLDGQDFYSQQLQCKMVENLKLKKYQLIPPLIKSFESSFDYERRMEDQFCRYIEIQMIFGNDKKKSALTLLNIRETVPRFNKVSLTELYLSKIEMQMIFDFAELNNDEDLFEQIAQYMQTKSMHTELRSNLYPKVVLKLAEKYIREENCNHALYLINSAIECLRDTHSLECMSELLDKKIEIMEIIEDYGDDYNSAAESHSCLGELRIEYGLHYNPDPLFKIPKQIYKFGDVLSRRRKMLRMSREDFEDTCSTYMMKAIESKRSFANRRVVKILLEKYKLSSDLYSSKIISCNYDMCKIADKLTKELSVHNYDNAKKDLAKLKKDLDLSHFINLQFVQHIDVLIKSNFSEIDETEQVALLKDALEITISDSCVFSDRPKYFSKREIMLINNIINRLENLGLYEELNKYVELMEDYYSKEELNPNNFDVYSLTMFNLQSIYGNRGEFKKSNSLIDKIMKFKLHNNDLFDLGGLEYAKAWNYKTEIENNQPMTDKETQHYMMLLNRAYTLAEICRGEKLKSFLEKKMENI